MRQARVSLGLFDRPNFLCLKRHLGAVMMKHLTLIRNKGSVIYYHNGGLLEFGGNTKFWETKGDNTKIFPLKRGQQKIFVKSIFWVLSFACIEICLKTLLTEHSDYHEVDNMTPFVWVTFIRNGNPRHL